MIGNVRIHVGGQIERQQLFACLVAEQFEHRRIHIQHALIALRAVYAIHRATHQCIVVRTRAHQGLLRQTALAHVARHGDVAGHRAVRLADDRHTRLHPDRRTIGATQQPGCDRETLASRHLLEQHRGNRALFRRHQRREVLTNELRHRKPEQLLEVARGIGHDTARIDGRHGRFDRLGQQSRQVATRGADGLERHGRDAIRTRVHQLSGRRNMPRNLFSAIRPANRSGERSCCR